MEFEHVTSDTVVKIIKTAGGIFYGLLSEVRELSKKKPDATLSNGKVKIINRVLIDLKGVLETEDEGKYLDLLDDQMLPQNSDALLVMVQYKTALLAFEKKYRKKINEELYWITEEIIKDWEDHEEVEE
jgi:hypothetical protein